MTHSATVCAAYTSGPLHNPTDVPLAFTPNGLFLLSDAAGGATVLTDVHTGKEARLFSLDVTGRTVSTVSTITARLTADGKQVRMLGRTMGRRGLFDLTFPPRSEPLRGWDIHDGREVLATTIPLRIADIAAFAPDGRVLLVARSRNVLEEPLVANIHKLHDLHTGAEWSVEAAESDNGTPLVFSGDGRLIAMVEPGRVAGATKAIQVFEALTGRRVARIPAELGRTTSLGFGADGQLLAAAGKDALYVWQMPTGKRVLYLLAKGRLTQWHRDGFATALDFSPGGKAIATGHADGTIHLWDLAPAWQSLAAPVPKFDPAACWTDLGAADAVTAYAAIDRLASAPDASLPVLKQRLHAVKADPAWLAARIRELDDDDFDTRRAAMRELSHIADAAESALRARWPSPRAWRCAAASNCFSPR